jgi:hypothetical protein
MTDQLRVQLAPVAPGEYSLKIYVSADAGAELRADLDAAGFETSEMAEFAFGVDDAIIGVVALGGLGGIAKVLNAFFHKNQHKSITLKSGDTEVTVTGMSKGETEDIIQKCLTGVDEQQKSLDESWQRILEETGENAADD